MTFTAPTTFSRGLEVLVEKMLLPTDYSSEELKALERSIKERAVFSAKTMNADYLQEVKDNLAKFAKGETNSATARANLQEMLDHIGYTPEKGGIEDLSSEGRTKLVLETGARQCANFALKEKGNSEMALFQYPAWELVRIYPREVPRGYKKGKGGALVEEPEDAWQARFENAGGELVDGRMVARKDDPVWEALGNTDDGLDSTFPPFAFNSGMGWRVVSREDCLSLGLDVDDVQPNAEGLNENFKVLGQYDKATLAALKAELDLNIRNGEMRMNNEWEEAA